MISVRVAALGVLLAVAVMVPVTLVFGQTSSPRLTRAAMLAYEKSVDPLVSRGGQVVEQGMKPALGDLSHDHITPPSYIAHEADGWAASLSDVRRELAAVTTPRQLSSARTSLLAALNLYVSAARTFHDAALAKGAEQSALITHGIDQAQHADTIFDQAARVIQAQRRLLHLGPSAYFPDPQG